MKKSIRRVGAVLMVCALSVCLLAGCGPTEPDPDLNSTTTVPDAATTTLDGQQAGTTTTVGGSRTVKPSVSAQPSQSSSTTAAPTQGAAAITGIAVNGTELADFNYSTKNYTYYLDAGTTAAPKVTATKNYGTGEIQITQPTGVNGTAKVSLNGDTYTIQFVVRRSEADMLKNTYYQLKTAKKLNVAYLGGSVTDGHGSTARANCWRSLTTKWLKSQYPTATITETNAAIGGTGTIYGAHRVIQDLKLTSDAEKPDLVFIEFAINDNYDKSFNTTPDVYMESIIQTIYNYAPQADIVMVFVTDLYRKDTDFAEKMAHKKIADAYQIPYVDIGARIWKEIVQEKGGSAPGNASDATWKKYFTDIVHPADAGYAKYAKYVQEFLGNIFAKKTGVPSGRTNSYKPAKTVTKLPVAPYVDNLKGLTPADNKLVVGGEGQVTSNKIGATFTFKFTGTDLKAWIYGQSTDEEQAGYIRVRVDDGDKQKISLKGNNHKILSIASGLSSGEHTVEVKLVSASSTGTAKLDLRNFLISGDAQMRGITLVE